MDVYTLRIRRIMPIKSHRYRGSQREVHSGISRRPALIKLPIKVYHVRPGTGRSVGDTGTCAVCASCPNSLHVSFRSVCPVILTLGKVSSLSGRHQKTDFLSASSGVMSQSARDKYESAVFCNWFRWPQTWQRMRHVVRERHQVHTTTIRIIQNYQRNSLSMHRNSVELTGL